MRSAGSFAGLGISGRLAERRGAPALTRSTPSTIAPSLFEALFDRALRPEGGFLQRLKEAGYDPTARRAAYEPRVLIDCLLVANDYCYPHLEADAAALRLGRRCIASALETRRRWLAGLPLTILGVELQLKKLVALIRSEMLFLPVELKRVCSGYWRVEVNHEVEVIPEFLAGMMEEGLAGSGVDLRVSVDRRPEGFAVAVRW